jgi:replicative superfamily II helicase
MTKEEFLEKIKKDVEELLVSSRLTNNRNQAFAWKLNANFYRTFDEEYLWSQALYLSTNCCLLLQEDKYNKMAIKGLSESAEIYESLGKLENTKLEYDKEYLLILSALCYDLAGYQANAYCIASSLHEYSLVTVDTDINLTIDNLIIDQISLILTKHIPLAEDKLKNKLIVENKGYGLFKSAMKKWYNYILKQEENDYLTAIDMTYTYFLNKGNVYLSHLLFLLKQRIALFDDRGIWSALKKSEEVQNNYQWRKYVRLLSFDYYRDSRIKKIEERKSIFEFWTSQLRSLEKNIIDSDENFIVQMPTSAGKTFIAELMILKNLIKYPDKKCLYIAPFRALNNEKEIELGKYLSKLGYSVSSLSGAYEIDDFQNVILSESNLLIATPEKIDSLLRFQPEIFNKISFVVVDEGHIIGDISPRATLLEFLLIRLRIKVKELKTLFISAVMPRENANEYSIWLNGKDSNVLRSLKFSDSNEDDEWEPTRKLISCFEWSGNNGNITFKNVEYSTDDKSHKKQGVFLNSFLKEKEFGYKFLKISDKIKKPEKKEISAGLAYKLSEEGSTLIFCGTVKNGIDSVAKSLLNLLNLVDVPERFNLDKNKKSSIYAEKWYGETNYITKAIYRGIGVHFGDMPEQVRIAVEEDFREGLLCILLSTNTIGQGLNFPIKNIIFHKIQIGGIKEYIQRRDFWNIIGRAGRAERETEGKIIFVIQTPNDRRLYTEFTNKNNIEPADSLIFKVLNSRLSQDIFSNYISTLSETYLLDLITEEIIGTDYENIIEEIIKNSLFKVQIDKNGLDIELIKKEFRQIFKSFEDNAEQLAVYKKTGLSLKSNKVLEDFIDKHISYLRDCINQDDYLKVIEFFLKMLTENKNDIPEMDNNKLTRLDLSPANCFSVIESWINVISLYELQEIWREKTNLEIEKLHIFIANALYYLYPWGITSFLIILSYKTGIEFKNLPENIKNIPCYLKFGLNKQVSCLARTLGIKSRETAKYLQEASYGLQGAEFLRWINNLTTTEIQNFRLSDYEKENIREVSLKLTSNKNNNIGKGYTFTAKGTSYNNNWMQNSKTVCLNDNLECKREDDNIYDPYSIILKKDSLEVGYIPRNFSKIISSEIDIFLKKYSVKVIDVIDRNDYNEIKVIMEEQNDN